MTGKPQFHAHRYHARATSNDHLVLARGLISGSSASTPVQPGALRWLSSTVGATPTPTQQKVVWLAGSVELLCVAYTRACLTGASREGARPRPRDSNSFTTAQGTRPVGYVPKSPWSCRAPSARLPTWRDETFWEGWVPPPPESTRCPKGSLRARRPPRPCVRPCGRTPE